MNKIVVSVLAGLALVGFGHIVGSTIEPPLPCVFHELTRFVQAHMGAAERVARLLRFGNDHAIDRVPFLRAQIENFDAQTRELSA